MWLKMNKISLDSLDVDYYIVHHPELFEYIEDEVLDPELLTIFFEDEEPVFKTAGNLVADKKCQGCVRGVTTPESYHDYGWDQAEWYCPVEDDCRWVLDGDSFYPSYYYDGDDF